MDTTRSPPQDSEHRREVSASPIPLNANIISNPAPPPQRIESRAKQRCFYAVSIVLLLGVLLASICLFTFFIIVRSGRHAYYCKPGGLECWYMVV